jgi:hypothetical protein
MRMKITVHIAALIARSYEIANHALKSMGLKQLDQAGAIQIMSFQQLELCCSSISF